MKEGGSMKALEDRIRAEGTILPDAVLKVSSFLNHQIDADFMMTLGAELARRYADAGVTKILTIESSGIAPALACGAALHVPVLFAKKHSTSNVSGDLYQTVVRSYTHGTDYTVVIERPLLRQEDCVLIVDDFLANGGAIEGLLNLVRQAGAAAAGAGILIEKSFQPGGSRLRQDGLRVESLAVIEKMDGTDLVFAEES